MRKGNNSLSPTSCKGIVQKAIDKAIEAIAEAIHEKRCAVCTTPFIPTAHSTNLQNLTASKHHADHDTDDRAGYRTGYEAKYVTNPSANHGTEYGTGYVAKHITGSIITDITWHSPNAGQASGANTPPPTLPTGNTSSPSMRLTIPPHATLTPLGSYAEAFNSACFCADCCHALPRLTTGFCPLCGDLSPWPLAPKSLCLNCLTHTPPWDSALFHGPYEGLLRSMLLDHKFSGALSLGYALGRLLARHPSLNSLLFDTIIPVPLHPQRLQQRGYNQSLEIAKGLHSYFRHKNIKLFAHHLQRTLPTRPQMGLSHTERQKNVRGVFTLNKPCANRHILLIDDVYTTGSTLRECATVLKKNGAASVHIATLARTRRQRLKA